MRKVLKDAIPTDNKNILINLRINKKDLEKIKKDAEKFYIGNLSAWIRYCCLNYKPKSDELTDF